MLSIVFIFPLRTDFFHIYSSINVSPLTLIVQYQWKTTKATTGLSSHSRDLFIFIHLYSSLFIFIHLFRFHFKSTLMRSSWFENLMEILGTRNVTCLTCFADSLHLQQQLTPWRSSPDESIPSWWIWIGFICRHKWTKGHSMHSKGIALDGGHFASIIFHRVKLSWLWLL